MRLHVLTLMRSVRTRLFFLLQVLGLGLRLWLVAVLLVASKLVSELEVLVL